MCKKLKKEGDFFIKISNLGTPELSAGYACLHAKTVETLFFKLVNTFMGFYFRKEPEIARAYFANLMLESFKDQDKAVSLGKEILEEIGTPKEIFLGATSTLTKKISS